MKYRFRTAVSRGAIRIEADAMFADISKDFSRWTFEAPLCKIHPYPIRSWSVPSIFWLCIVGGVGGIVCSVFQYFDSTSMPDPPWITHVALTLSIGLAIIAFFVRREEWVAFPTEIDGVWVRYARSGPDRKRFDEFTEEVCKRISLARDESPQ